MEKCKTKIYIANVDCLRDRALFDLLYSGVRKERRDKIDKLRFDEDKRLSLGVELLLKKALSDFGIDYSAAEFEYGENGKPYIKGNEIFFNLSHSGNMACCAVSDSEIGIDTEQIERADFKIAKKIFTKGENIRINNTLDKNSSFIRYWTLKESYMKYCGSGLLIAPKKIEIEFYDNIPHYKGLSFFEYEADGYRFALCGSSEAEIEFVYLTA